MPCSRPTVTLPAPALASAALTALVVLVAGLVGRRPHRRGAPAVAAEGVSLSDLEVERKATPIGIDLDRPRFGWVIESPARGVVQESYRVRVATEAEGLDGDLTWDSGTVAGRRAPSTWSTTVRRSSRPPATSGTSRSSPTPAPPARRAPSAPGFVDQADWDGAAWIGAPPPADPTARWTDYTAEFDFSIQRHAFGAFVRANGLANSLMWQVSVVDGVAALRPHRKVNGGYTLLENKNISSFITAAAAQPGPAHPERHRRLRVAAPTPPAW